MFGEGWYFLIDGLSYFAVIASLLMMQLRLMDAKPAKASMFEQMREGWDYVRTFRPVRSILLLFSLISLMGWPYSVLLPIFAGHVLHGGPYTLGWLKGASGVGALVSALSLAARKSVVGLPRMIQISAALFGVGLILFGLSHTLWLSLLLMGVVGFGMIQCASASNTVIQSLVPESSRLARARDGLLRYGLCWSSAIRQPVSGRPRSLDGSACRRHHHRCLLRCRLPLVSA
jgi:Na+/melibiose symporter-like transporter